MWPKPSTLVFLTAAVAALVVSGQAPVILDQTENRRVEVLVGSSVTFHCGLMTEMHERFRVVWHFNPSGSSFSDSQKLPKEIVNISAKTSSKMSNTTKPKNTEETSLIYTLSNATDQNSGWYFCKVIIEIPLLTNIISSGTEVVITNTTPTDNFQLMDWWMWILLAASAFILIVLLIICVCLRRRRYRSRADDPIYANTRPVANKQPSPRPRILVADNLKPVSSSQNLRIPSPGRKYNDGKRRYKQ